MMVFRQTLAI